MRIGSTLFGVDWAAQKGLMDAVGRLNESSLRLSTLKAINRAGDDPAGLIAADSLAAELTSIEAAQASTARAHGAIRVADSGLGEVSTLLDSIRGNLLEAAGNTLGDAEKAAKQVEIDAALQAIDRIGGSTSFGGRKVLSGGEMTVVVGPSPGDTATLALPNVSAAALGGSAGRLSELASGGSASIAGGNIGKAMEIVDAAAGQVRDARAEAGAFEKYTLDSSQHVLDGMRENLSAAYSEIADTDVALETSRMVQAQIFVRSALASLGIANERRGMVLELLEDV